MLKRKIIILSLGILIIGVLVSCNNKNNKVKKEISSEKFDYNKEIEKKAEYKYFKDCPVKANEVLLYHSYKDNLGIYNTDTKTWKELYNSEKNNLFTYRVRGQEQKNVFYTIGSTSYNDFSVVKYNPENRMAESLLDVDKKDSVIPIGIYEDKMYFIHNKDDLGDSETRSIAYMDGNKLIDVLDVKDALLSNGIIVGRNIYYTIYSPESDLFDLYCYSFKNNKTSKKAEIQTDKIYRYKDELMYVDNKNDLLCLEKGKINSLKNNSDIDILSDYGLMLQIYINKDSDIACDVINMENNKVVETVSKFDGYIVNEGILELYCEGNIKKLEM